MDYTYIEQLIDRYFEGQTTLEEEHILRAFFAGASGKAEQPHELPEHLRRWQPLFTAGKDLAEARLDESFDERMLALTGEYRVKALSIPLHVRLRPLLRAAAFIAFAVVIGSAVEHSTGEAGERMTDQMAVQGQDELDADEAKPLDIRSAELTDTLKIH